MGVVGCPDPERNFDGRVCLKRVSVQKKTTKASRNKGFSVDHVQVNMELCQGRWRMMIVDNKVAARKALDLIIDMCDLDAFVADRLSICHLTHAGDGNKKQFVDIKMNRGWTL